MTDHLPIREPDQIRKDCARKLRSVQVSRHFQAILGCLLGEDWTTPRLVEMVITPDVHMLGSCEGEESFKAFLGGSEVQFSLLHLSRAIAGVRKVEKPGHQPRPVRANHQRPGS